MALVSIFFIVLITAFAVVAFFTEPSQADKQINSRLALLDRKRGPSADEEDSILREVTFSKIRTLDRFLRHSGLARSLSLLIEQSGLEWTVGRMVFTTLVIICVGAVIGQWWIAPGLLGWAPGLALGASPYVFLVQRRQRRFRRIAGASCRHRSHVERSTRGPGVTGDGRDRR